MEITQGISLCSYLYLKLAKTLFLFLSFVFFFYKIGEQEGRTGSGWGSWYQWEREVAGKGVGG
jgi:hypothetical protein